MNDLTSITRRLGEQVERVENDLKVNMRKIRKIESLIMVQLGRTKRDLTNLENSADWMEKLLKTIDSLGEIEKFLTEIEDINKDTYVEEVSLESLMEYDARVPF